MPRREKLSESELIGGSLRLKSVNFGKLKPWETSQDGLKLGAVSSQKNYMTNTIEVGKAEVKEIISVTFTGINQKLGTMPQYSIISKESVIFT